MRPVLGERMRSASLATRAVDFVALFFEPGCLIGGCWAKSRSTKSADGRSRWI